MKRFRQAIFFAATSFVIAPAAFAVGAETASLRVVWKASSYVPVGYAGKAMPVAGTPVAAYAFATRDGKPLSLAPYAARWYVDGSLVSTSKGDRPFVFAGKTTGGETIGIRLSIPEFGEVFADIPLKQPEVVIDRSALPRLMPLYYFFSIKLPDEVESLWEDTAESITVRAKNKLNPLEFARAILFK